MDEARIDPQHSSARGGLRTAGAICAVAGGLLLVFGAVRMFSPAWSDREDPGEGFLEGQRPFSEVSRRMDDQFHETGWTMFSGFGMAAGGMVLLVAGLAMLKFGYMGRVARYAAAEIAPVAGDTINYMGDKTRDTIRGVSSAISQGIAEGVRSAGGAGAASPADQAAPPRAMLVLRCPRCRADNDPGARFCDQCGAELTPQP